MPKDTKTEWEQYRARELAWTIPLLEKLGFSLDDEQPHMGGERFLMQAITTESGRKLILLGRHKNDGRRVVIKATSDPNGVRELQHERICRRMLREIRFAYHPFLVPEEILFKKQGSSLLSIQAFIDQEQPFLARPIAEQAAFALRAFKTQESAHAATYEHEHVVARTFGRTNSEGYVASFASFLSNILYSSGEAAEIEPLLREALQILTDNTQTIEQYSGFLTHTDFVPHNFRIVGQDLYLLDTASLRFGNKYEGWARFLNFMALYNRPLEEALVKYVAENRTPEESASLRLMRIFRLGEIIWYYCKTLPRSDGDLLVLNTARVRFWSRILEGQVHEHPVSETVVEEYIQLRDRLRSEEEKKRQQGLH